MIRNILADVMVGLGIIILVTGLFFVFNIWPVTGENNNQLEQAVNQPENNVSQNKSEEQETEKNNGHSNEYAIEKEYFTQKKITEFNTDFAWERNLSFNNNNINFSESFAEEKKEKVEIVIPAGSSASVIANKLSEKGVMDREKFIDTLIIFDAEKKLNSGTYVFEKDEELLEVFSKILVGGGDYSD